MKYLFDHKNAAGWVIAIFALLFITSCKDDDDKSANGFNVDQKEVQFVNDGGTIELKVATNEAWTAETDADWCMVSPANGQGSGICVIKADSSYLYKDRVGKVRFYSDSGTSEVIIKQFGYEYTINFTKSELIIPSYAASDKAYVDVEAVANVPFQVVIPESAAEWLTLSGESTYEPASTVPRKQKFRFKFKTYTEAGADRIAEVQFVQTQKNRDGETELLNKTVRIIQEKAPLIIPSREGDSLAILAIARVYGLGNYNWPTSRPITDWDDVVTAKRTYRYKYGNIDKDSTELRVISIRYFMMDTNEGIPYQVKFLSELETFIATGNANRHLRNIKLGPEITTLKHLKSLSMMGYGINELPAEFGGMQSLEELDLSGNNFLKLPISEIMALENLKFLDFSANRMVDGVNNIVTDIPKDYTLETIGLGGELPPALFMKEKLEYLSLAYNYFYGSIPDMEGIAHVMPNMKELRLNLNRLTGNLPKWILNHERIVCWDPFTLVFSQEGYGINGKFAGFDNAPQKISDLVHKECPDDKDDNELMIALKLPELSKRDVQTKIPLHGHWRYYKMLTK